MKTILVALTLIASNAIADTYVQGYYRRDGTYVQGHYRSSSDGDRSNNWSTRGNQNPYTGQWGTKSNDSYDNSYNQPRKKSIYGY